MGGFFDPLGVLDGASQKKFERFRSNEIKHGRIAMLACAGHFTTSAGIRIGGDIDLSGISFQSIPSGLAAFGKMPAGGLIQLILFVGFLELFVMKMLLASLSSQETTVMVLTLAGILLMKKLNFKR